MPLPHFLARPAFHVIYLMNRRMEGALTPPIRRAIRPLDEKQRVAFDHLFDSAQQSGPNTLIDYNLPYPKSNFVNYLCDWRGFVIHGSPIHDLEVLQPIRKSGDDNEFGNRQQIFGSPDAIWAMWFAILDKSKYNLTRNGCVRVGLGTRRVKYYYFELPNNNRENKPFTDGMLYITRAEDFPDKRPYPLLDYFNAEIEEWGSTTPITPLARIKIKPEDFPYLDQVQFGL
jgi:hypothetical protein